MNNKRIANLWLMGFIVIALAALPFYGGGRATGIVITMAITMISVVGLQLTMGYAGQVNLGQSAFMGVGAFAAGFCVSKLGFSALGALFFGGLAAALFGLIFGAAAIRIKGFYLALTTIAAQYVFAFMMLKLPSDWFGQAEGLRLPPATFFNITLDNDKKIYWFVFGVLLFSLIGAGNLVRSKTGLAFIAVRDQESAAPLLGLNVVKYKLLAFLIGASYAGVAGGLWAIYVRYVQVDQFTLWASIWYAGMLIVGGIGSIWGAIIGTIVIRLIQEGLTFLGPQLAEMSGSGNGQIVFASMNIILGLAIMVSIIFARKGLIGILPKIIPSARQTSKARE